MKRFAQKLLWLVLTAVLGWAAMGVGLRRSVSAVWKDIPMTGRAPYLPAERAHVENRLHQIGKAHDVVGLADWLNEIATETSVDRLRAAVDAAKALPERWQTFAARTALERLADVDPAAALDFTLLRLGNGTPGWNALANLVRLRAGSDPGSVRPFLTAAAMQLCHGQGGVAELGRLRPSECLDAIARFHLPLEDPGVKECLGGACAVDPARVVAMFNGDMHISAVAGAFDHWLERDPVAVLAWMGQRKEFSEYGRWGAIARIALKTGDAGSIGEFSAEKLTAILDTVARRDADLAAKVFQSLSPEQRLELGGRLLSRPITSAMHSNTLRWLESLPPELRAPSTELLYEPVQMDELPRWLSLGLRAEMLDAETAALFRGDPSASRQWLEELPPAARTGALPGMARGLADVDPQQAADLLATQPRGQRWAEAVDALARSWGAHDPDAAKKWIDTLPPVTARAAMKAAELR